MEDLTGKVDSAGPPTGQLTAAEWNHFLTEIKNLIATLTGQTMSSGDLLQLAKSIVTVGSAFDWYTGGGTANAQVLSVVSARPGAVSLATGLRVRWRPSVNNTGAATINVNGLGVKNIKREDGTNLQAGDLSTTRDALAVYDGTQFLLANSALGAPAQALPSGYITGLNFTPPTADRTHQITLAVGSCRDSTNAANLVVSSSITKKFDGASIAYGTGQTGFPTTSLSRAAATWYRVFLVGHVDGRVDVGFDTDAAATNLLDDLVAADSAGWTYFRQIGWVRTQAADSTAFVPFVQYSNRPGRVHWIQGNQLFDQDGALVTARTSRSLLTLAPPLCVAHVNVLVEPPNSASVQRRNLLLTDTNQADYTPTDTLNTLSVKSASGPGFNSWTPGGLIQVRLDSSGNIYERWDAAGNWTRTLAVPCWDFAR